VTSAIKQLVSEEVIDIFGTADLATLDVLILLDEFRERVQEVWDFAVQFAHGSNEHLHYVGLFTG
jgi:hypothetical protein